MAVGCSVNSAGCYVLCGRLLRAPRPPQHACNRGLCAEGLGSLLAGLLGAAGGTAASIANTCAGGLTQVGIGGQQRRGWRGAVAAAPPSDPQDGRGGVWQGGAPPSSPSLLGARTALASRCRSARWRAWRWACRRGWRGSSPTSRWRCTVRVPSSRCPTEHQGVPTSQSCLTPAPRRWGALRHLRCGRGHGDLLLPARRHRLREEHLHRRLHHVHGPAGAAVARRGSGALGHRYWGGSPGMAKPQPRGDGSHTSPGLCDLSCPFPAAGMGCPGSFWPCPSRLGAPGPPLPLPAHGSCLFNWLLVLLPGEHGLR